MAHGAAISHHHGIGLNRSRFLPEALGAGFDVLAGLKQTFDPAGILNPGKFGLPSPFGPPPGDVPVSGDAGGSVLVVDVGTSGVRAAIVRPDATVEHVHHAPVLPDTPAPGLVEFDAGGHGRRRAGRRPGRAGRRRSGRRRGHRQPAGLDHRVGAGHRDAARPGHRLAGPAHRRHLPRPPGRGHPARPQRLGHQGDGHPRRRRPRPRPGRAGRAVLRDGRHLGGLGPLGRRGRRQRAPSTSPTPPTPPSPPWSHPATVDWDEPLLERLRIPRAMLPRDRRLVGPASATPTPWTARPRSAASPATSRPPSSGRAARCPGLAKATFGTGGMLDQCTGTAGAPAVGQPRSGRDLSDRGLPGRRHHHLGHRGRHALGRDLRRVAARRPRPHRLGQRVGHRRRPVRDARATSGSCPPCSGWARRCGTSAPGAPWSG